ncbi:MAG: ABC transporter permease [Desulfotalea sp.]|nr:MAG: ABC transporter permease [Desulfotalea sp.]
MRLEPREHSSLLLRAVVPFGSAVVALLACSVLILWADASPVQAFFLFIKGSVGSKFALSETLARTIPLIFTGLAVAVAFKAKLWNIGAEGQLYGGACMATWLGTGMIDLPGWLMLPLLFAAGALLGGLLLLGPTLLKTWLAVDEVVTTLLLNFIILLFVNYLVFGPWKDPMAMGWPQAAPMVDTALLSTLLAKTRLHMGLIWAFGASVLLWLFMRFTTWGYQIRAVGYNAGASRFAGIPVNPVVVRTALISGGLAGCAGVSELCGLKGYLTLDLSPGFGYSGIVVAMLAGLHPLGVVVAAFFVAMLSIGADSMSRALNISNYIADVATAVSLLAVLVSMLLVRYRIRWK